MNTDVLYAKVTAFRSSCYFETMAMAASGKRRSFYADLDRLRQHFDSLDAEQSGHIGFKELTKLVESMPGVEESAVPELMDRLDRDKDGKVCKVLLLYVVNISCAC